ncbi:hypothetical protein O6H91_01G035500 [Diphasiastrum complanatum]|uniref:Uncharacterized protein n=1 Tax=Diphasiastrum complanatum TaxID=34168 RepID=A0ACC2EPT5_DIPCM|nr:hypothetical protein O6H91_01G035500 [Diphasiastrum complanatum]
MPFTLHVIYETLRLTNVSHGLYRTPIEDIQYQGYTISKGWTVLAYARAVHLDGDIYEDPLAFNPWRWKVLNRPCLRPSIASWYLEEGQTMRRIRAGKARNRSVPSSSCDQIQI